jgi:glutamate N-acetyltransferase/amino-acid N-acetyltransferase
MTFFSSRWTQRPEHVRELRPSDLPAGFRAAGVAAGIKPDGLDVGVLVSDAEATVSAARFSSSGLLGAPVVVTQEAEVSRLRAVVATSGNANVADGRRGLDTATASQRAAAETLGIEPGRVGLASTGVIGRELPRERLIDGIRRAGAELGDHADRFSRAIMTSDRAPKRACLEVELERGTVRLAAQAKGAGMISPRFATMFCFVETDAALDAESLDLLTRVCVARSFERISVDAQLSTSDTVIVFANGRAGVAVDQRTRDELLLGEALDALMRQLALEIVADGEGARRIARIVVRGDPERVEAVARAVADSPLVKTALHGADPNFGRILCATGMSLRGEPFLVDLEIEGRQVASGGVALEIDQDEWRELEQAVQADEVEYVLTIPGDGGETELFFSDLSHDYVTLNAEYTT